MTVSPLGRVLLLDSATGNGHRSVARAIQDSIAEVSDVKCWEIEVFAEVRPPLIGSWPAVYSSLATRSVWLYNVLFRLTDTPRISSAMSRVIYKLAEPKIKAILLDIDPDVVVVTSPFVSQVAAQARRDLQARFGIVNVVSDLVNPHASWACREADVTVACCPSAKSRLLRQGMHEQKIVVTAFPVQHAFYKSKMDKEELRRELGLELELFTITLSGGGLGSGPILSHAKALNEALPQAQLLIVAGHNRRLYNLLKSQIRDVRNRVYGFTEQMPTLLGASDVVVSKAGPSSIMEACAVGRPVVVIDEVGLQEKGNGSLAQQMGIGYRAETVSGMIKIVESLKQGLDVTGEEDNTPCAVDGSREIARIVLEFCVSQ